MADEPDIVTTIAEVARHFGVSDRTVQRWLAEPGFPGAAGERGKRNGKFSLKAIEAWKLERDGGAVVDKDSPKYRKAEADAAIRELELAELEGRLIDVAEVSAEMERAIHNAKSVLGELADEIVDELPAAVKSATRGKIRKKIEQRVKQACQRLAQMAEGDLSEE